MLSPQAQGRRLWACAAVQAPQARGQAAKNHPGLLLRECGRKLTQMELPAATSKAMARLQAVMQRAQRIYQQRTKDKNKLYAMHAPEVECIGKGKARKPYEFWVKVSIAVSHS